jgi:hypothetical protein
LVSACQLVLFTWCLFELAVDLDGEPARIAAGRSSGREKRRLEALRLAQGKPALPVGK